MPQNTEQTQERAQPWQKMKEVEHLFKTETPEAPAESKKDEEPLKLNVLRAQFNSARPNIANVEEQH